MKDFNPGSDWTAEELLEYLVDKMSSGGKGQAQYKFGKHKGALAQCWEVFHLRDFGNYLITEEKTLGDRAQKYKDNKRTLEKRGERVIVLNPGGLFPDILGDTDQLNPLDVIVDSLHRPGGLRDIPDDLRELCTQLLPEPAGQTNNDTYWREGARKIKGDAILLECIVEGYDATLEAVALLIEDRKHLEQNLRWVVGVDMKGNPLPEGPMPLDQADWASNHAPEDLKAFGDLFRAHASNGLALMTNEDSKTFDSFVSSAQQALAPYAYGSLSTSMRRSSFSLRDMRNPKKPTTIFIVPDASRMESHQKYVGLTLFAILTALKRHPNKRWPVHLILDEVSNYFVQGLESLLTWGRGFGIRLLLVFQDFAAGLRRGAG
ncbi:type IV secretory system conjugative DNA transfer family protein [Algiphilus sp. W345]|uniref:Type IV secretory system conjugative DNA transfer family protein n=1 Tax=Banduia mediterranea TaxID=3075609 RepID=A0ABU2WPA2_9GAMM|nr:type IV secretory system conjugative DNA transfer family protein [Algiphilus sp. W345]MDT0499171.1 type IV secretory system conjugative DNA transfer family protein [Algiphilus sp. W345]